jgi:hypothetical protein
VIMSLMVWRAYGHNNKDLESIKVSLGKASMRMRRLHHEDMSTMINTYKMSMKEILL